MVLEPASNDIGYESKYLPLMKKYLDSEELDVHVIGSSNSINIVKRRFPKAHAVPIFPSDSNGKNLFLGYPAYLLWSFLKTIQLARKNHCQAIVSLGGHPYTGLVVSVAARITYKKSVIRISEPTRIIVDNRYAFGRLVASLVGYSESVSLHFADLIVANRDMRWYHRRVASKQLILTQGIDVNHFKKLETVSANPDHFPTLITVARLDKQKNIKSVIESVKMLKSKYPKIYYCIIGTGPDEKELREQAKQAGIEDHIQFYGYAGPDKVPNLLNCANYFVLPSLVEGLPSAVLEAMSCGLPTILASTKYSCQDLFKHDVNTLITSGTAKSIADAVDRLASNPQLSAAISANGLRYVQRCHDCSKTKQRFASAIKHLIR